VSTIALDFDETYTADPELWKAFIKAAQNRGHVITFVTFRNPDGMNRDIEEACNETGLCVVYSAGRQKQHVFVADIWIDDMPICIPSYSSMLLNVMGCEKMGDTQ
jgi:hypothetical protein